ncbi:hypothetical protein [Sphingobacterium sp. CZ-2]|uniref:hypothetical protein n=1 Tax=Sphingobacterium sp. CZ-2 TaxID=2557994 RepID=UPI00106FAFE5|nr:hypothetical protein [Sphingobacterium sp. CZ-2]QBR13625.1 hypothetical protein E3D81_16130 [Sphingobacterium sp. CZ-2]
MKSIHIFCLVVIIGIQGAWSQTGLTAGPPRIYFVSGAGQEQFQFVEVSNPSSDYELQLAISFEDWSYSELGENQLSNSGSLPNSCSDWLSVSEGYFSLKPGESKRIQLRMKVPPISSIDSATSVHTAMLFITQMNPRARQDRDGANIRLAVRSGIKVYHRFPAREQIDLEVTDLKVVHLDSLGGYLETDFQVSGNVWVEGRIRTEFLNQGDGRKVQLKDVSLYCLPGDRRKHFISIPKDLSPGKYLASVMFLFDEQDLVKIAEIEFNKHE